MGEGAGTFIPSRYRNQTAWHPRMNGKEVTTLVRVRLDQARTALDDARYLIDGGRSSQSTVIRQCRSIPFVGLMNSSATPAGAFGGAATPPTCPGFLLLFVPHFPTWESGSARTNPLRAGTGMRPGQQMPSGTR